MAGPSVLEVVIQATSNISKYTFLLQFRFGAECLAVIYIENPAQLVYVSIFQKGNHSVIHAFSVV